MNTLDHRVSWEPLTHGALLGGLFVYVVLVGPTSNRRSGVRDGRPQGEVLSADLFGGVLRATSSGLGGATAAEDGDYLFLPNRRTVWVVDRAAGRFANFDLRDTNQPTVVVSRTVTLDPVDFPPGETDFLLSDRNLTPLLWVCNRTTGELQLFRLKPDGEVRASTPVASKRHLRKKV